MVLWGMGDVADCLLSTLEPCGIQVDAIWLDGDISEREHRGIPALPKAELDERYAKYIVILGHSKYEKALDLRGDEKIGRVFYKLSVAYHQPEHIRYSDVMRGMDVFEEVYDALADDVSRRHFAAYRTLMFIRLVHGMKRRGCSLKSRTTNPLPSCARGAAGIFLEMSKRHPARVCLVSYEKLEREPEGEARRMFDFCGLPFEWQTQAFLTASQAETMRDAYAVYRRKGEARRGNTGCI